MCICHNDPNNSNFSRCCGEEYCDNCDFRLSDCSCAVLQPVRKISWLQPESAQTIRPEAGEVYQFMHDCSTRAGHIHPRGSLLYLEYKTTETPFDEIGPEGYNWMCRNSFGRSIWSTVESCIERKILKRVITTEVANLFRKLV
jgi:hypothetical protein